MVNYITKYNKNVQLNEGNMNPLLQSVICNRTSTRVITHRGGVGHVSPPCLPPRNEAQINLNDSEPRTGDGGDDARDLPANASLLYELRTQANTRAHVAHGPTKEKKRKSRPANVHVCIHCVSNVKTACEHQFMLRRLWAIKKQK